MQRPIGGAAWLRFQPSSQWKLNDWKKWKKWKK
jgi:hypothetical protein